MKISFFHMAFRRVPMNRWMISSKVRKGRRDRLQNAPSYKTIIQNIEDNILNISAKTVRMKKEPDYFRYEVTIAINQKIVDEFHNSSSGYRAQYLSSVANGKKAN